MAGKKEQLGILELTCGIAGMICPVPVAGEILLSGFLYPIVKKIPLFNPRNNKNAEVSSAITSMCIAGLTRFPMYEPFYIPMMNYIQRLF